MSDKTPQVRAFWAEFRAAAGIDHDDYTVFFFGDSPEMANELLELVINGPKRATAGLARDYAGDERPPKPGDYSIVVNGSGQPGCVIRTTDVTIQPLSAADEQFAWEEGEGDRTLAWWMDAHVRFFTRQAEAEGFEMHHDIETVFERFELVWPAPD